MSSHASLSAAADDRKKRLANLKSLKRKQAEVSQEDGRPSEEHPSEEEAADQTNRYLSGRNYDTTTRGPKLGFEHTPNENVTTLEQQAQALESNVQQEAEKEAAADQSLDLFKLQPKKPNWDLKRDLDQKLAILDVRTDNAIARLVRERVNARKNAASGDSDKDTVGSLEGPALVEATHIREREEQEEARKEREADLADSAG